MTTFESEQPTVTTAASGPTRDAARKRLEAKRGFASNVVAYVVINGFMIAVWAITGGGYFWPAWLLGGWGVALTMHAFDVFGRQPITEADIDEEVRRLEDRHTGPR